MNEKLNWAISYFILTSLFLSYSVIGSFAQQVSLVLPDVEAGPGQEVTVDVLLSDNTQAAQGGIFIVFDPEIANVEDAFSISPGADLNDSSFFITPSVKDLCLQNGAFISDCTGTLGTVNTMGVSSGIFPRNFPPDIIPDGTILRIIFRVNPDAGIGEMTELEISTQSFFATSLSTTQGSTLSSDDLNLVNGSITVIQSTSGSGCSAASPLFGYSIVNVLILFLPFIIFALRLKSAKNSKFIRGQKIV